MIETFILSLSTIVWGYNEHNRITSLHYRGPRWFVPNFSWYSLFPEKAEQNNSEMRLVWTQTLGLLLGLMANTHRVISSLLALVTEVDKSAAWIPIKVEGVTSNSWWKGWVWRLSGVLSPCGGRSLHHPPAQPRWASNELPPVPASSQWGASGATV